MRRSDLTSLLLLFILGMVPSGALARGHFGGGGRGGFPGHVGSFGLAPIFGSPFAPAPRGWTPGWGWFGRPGAFGVSPSTSPSGFVAAPFHTPYAAPFWTGNAASLTMKPDEAAVLQSESRMEEQIRALQDAPKDESSEKGHDAASEEDSGEWQPL